MHMTAACFGCKQQLKRNDAIKYHMQMGRIVAKQILVFPKLTSANKRHQHILNFRKGGQERAEQLLVALVIKQ